MTDKRINNLINEIRKPEMDELAINELEAVTGGSHASKHGDEHGRKPHKLSHDQAPKA